MTETCVPADRSFEVIFNGKIDLISPRVRKVSQAMDVSPRRHSRQETAQQHGRSWARPALWVMAAFALSNLVGLVRQILVSQAFGTTAAMDAFNAANRVPDILFNLLAGGALGSAFIPVFTELLAQGKQERAWRLASALATNLVLVFGAAGLLVAAAAPWVVGHLLAPGFPPSQQALTVRLLHILLVTPLIFGLSGLMMALLHVHRHFLLPALAPTMYWLGMIFGVLVWAPQWGIFGLAWGAVLGAIGHAGIQLPHLMRLSGSKYRPSLGWRMPELRRVLRLMGPRWLGVAIVQLNFWINVVLASGMPEGSLTALQMAWAVMTMPQVVLAQAMAIVALPTFSSHAAHGDMAALRRSLLDALRWMVLLSLPASVGLILLRVPVIQVLFQRGAFDAHSTQLVAWALLWYALGLVAHSVVEILARGFYALQDTRTPVMVGGGAMALNVLLSLVLAWLFRQWGLFPHGGLALANTLATTLEMFGLLLLFSRRVGAWNPNAWGRTWLQSGAATLVMAVFLPGTWRFLADHTPGWMALTATILIGAGLYGLMLSWMGVPEAHRVRQWVLQRWKRQRDASPFA